MTTITNSRYNNSDTRDHYNRGYSYENNTTTFSNKRECDINIPRDVDVVFFSRGATSRKFPKQNQLYKHLLEDNIKLYYSIPTSNRNEFVIEKIIKPIYSVRGKFFSHTNHNYRDHWTQIKDGSVILKKIRQNLTMQSFREIRKKQNQEQKQKWQQEKRGFGGKPTKDSSNKKQKLNDANQYHNNNFPRKFDVILHDRGQPVENFENQNKFYKTLLMDNYMSYYLSPNLKKQEFITEKIIKPIYDLNGKFLSYDQDGKSHQDLYIEIDDVDIVIAKIEQDFDLIIFCDIKKKKQEREQIHQQKQKNLQQQNSGKISISEITDKNEITQHNISINNCNEADLPCKKKEINKEENYLQNVVQMVMKAAGH